jgi:ketosteroid isomerase-like protein
LSIWDEEGVQLFPGNRAGGLQVLREVIPARFETVTVKSFELDTADITVAEGYAIAHWSFLRERVVNGELETFDGKFLTILKRQAGGSWKIFRDCINSNDH